MLALRLFGEMAIEADGRPRSLPDRRPGRLLLGWLALHRGVHARGDVAAALWPDVRSESARTSLRSALAAVRQAVGDGDHLVTTRSGIGLGGDVSVDATEFRALAGSDDPDAALALYRGPLLQGLDEDWVQRGRDEFATLAADTMGAAAQRAGEAGDETRAVQLARRRIALDDLSEAATCDLVRRLAATGDRAGALSAYNALAERLHAQLRVVPSMQTRRLVASIRHGAPILSSTPQLPLPLPVEGPALFGRGPHLAAIGEDAAIALICGDAGMGKSRVLTEVAAEAHAAGAQVLVGRCRPERELPYAPVADALRLALETAEFASPPAGLAALLPELAAPGAAEDAGPDAARLYAAVMSLLRAIGGERRVVLLVDDAHWADPSTLRMLDHLLVAAPPLALRIVVAYRPTTAENLAGWLGRWRRRTGAVDVLLEGLDEVATRGLLEALAGRTASAPLARAVHERTEGHPLFLRELVRHWQDAWPSVDAVAGAELPHRVSGVMLERAVGLSTAGRRTLAIAAVFGESFSLASLCAVHGDEDTTLDALDEAVEAALLREEGAGRYAFVHTVAREAIYGALTETRRAHLHRRIAETLEASGADVRRVAEHHLLAGELGDPAKAADYSARAADRAAEQHAHEDAAALYERALGALPATVPGRCRLLLDLGRARRLAGEGAAAREAFVAAGGLAHDLPDGALIAEAALGLCSIPFFPGTDAADDLAITLLENALAQAGGTVSPSTVRLRAYLAREGYFVRGAPATLTAVEEALAQALELADDQALIAVLDVLSPALVGQASPARRRDVAENALRLADHLGERELGLRARIWRVLAALQAGESSSAAPDEAALEEAAVGLRQPAWRWWPALWRAMRALRAGELEEGERLALAAWRLGEQALGERAEVELQAQLFWIRREQGRLGELDAFATSLSDRYRAIPAWRCVRAIVDAELGRTDRARAELEALAVDDFAALRDASRLVSLTLAADVSRLTGAVELVPALRDQLEPHAGEWPVSGYGGLVLAPVDTTLRALTLAEVSQKAP